MMAGAAYGCAPTSDDPEVEFDVVLVSSAPGARLPLMKEIRARLGLGLSEAKAMVDRMPTYAARGLSRGDAKELQDALVAAGAVVDVKGRS